MHLQGIIMIQLFAWRSGKCSTHKMAGGDFACKSVAYFHSQQGGKILRSFSMIQLTLVTSSRFRAKMVAGTKIIDIRCLAEDWPISSRGCHRRGWQLSFGGFQTAKSPDTITARHSQTCGRGPSSFF